MPETALDDLPQPDYVGFEVDADNYQDVIERRIGEAKRQRAASVNQEEEPADD